MILGLDFDNTIVSYDDLIFETALSWGWINPDMVRHKKAIRDYIRETQDDIAWQKLQAYIYGPGMKNARLMDGVDRVIYECHRREIPVYVISHKTSFASMDHDKKYDLQQTARDWMTNQGFFDKTQFAFDPGHVFFETTRLNKIERIVSLQCNYFVDDLEETFMEPTFPQNVTKLHYTQDETTYVPEAVLVHSWEEIYRALFVGC